MPHRNFSSRASRSQGFGLVEIMVAMVIGMIAMVVVMQVFFESESKNRNAAGTADAQSAGVLAFYQLQSHIKKAGYGLDSIGLFNCQTSWTVPKPTPSATAAAAIDKAVYLAPVSINPVGIKGGVTSTLIPAGDANTDTLLVFYGTSNGQPQGNVISSVSGSTYTVQQQTMFAIGDRVLVGAGTSPDACGSTAYSIDYVTAVGASAPTVAVSGTAVAGNALFNLGRGPSGASAAITTSNPSNGPTILAFAVRSGSLTVCDFTVNDCSLAANASSTSVWVPIAANVPVMRAVYWSDASTAWNGSTSSNSQTQPTNACGWARVRAVSLVLVIRNSERNKTMVTTTYPNNVASAADANAPTWDQVSVAPLVSTSGALGPDTAADEEWKYYRYKTFQSLIPLRNVTWMGQPTGCT